MRRDSGLTLIELLVAAALTVGVFLIIGTIFVSTFVAQRTVSAITSTTNSAQQAAQLIEEGMRNASEFRVSATGGNELLVMRTATQSSVITWVCVGWYYRASDDTLLRKTTSDGTAITAPTTAAQTATWQQMVTGVTPRGATVFRADGAKLFVAFDAASPGELATTIETTAVRSSGVTGVSTC